MGDRNEREVSRRVIRERVVGSSNPIATWGREAKGKIVGSLQGFFFGILLFFVTFALPFCAATTEKDSKEVARLEQIAASETSGYTGKVIVSGTISAGSEVTPDEVKVEGDILGYHFIRERYETWTETVEETHTEIRDGQEIEVVEEVTKEFQDWKVLDDKEKWAEVKLGSIIIDPKYLSTLPRQKVHDKEYENRRTGEKLRESMTVVRPGHEVILATELENGQIADDPDFCRLSLGTKDELVSEMHQDEETSRWTLIVLSVILWTISYSLILGPAILIFNLIPIKAVGAAANSLTGFIALVLAVISTAITYILVAYWWLVIAFTTLVVLAIVFAVSMSKKSEDDEAQPDSADS